MSLYRSEAVLNNVTSTDITVNTIVIYANSSVKFWSTQDHGVLQAVLNIFTKLRDDQQNLNPYIQNGSLTVVKDGMTLSYDQYLIVFSQMVDAVAKATDINQLMLPMRSQPTQSDGIPLSVQAPREGNEWVIGSHNFADVCSWFGDSVRVHDEVLADSGDGLTFNSNNSANTRGAWVDMTSGRCHDEANWVNIQKANNPSDPHGYQLVVKVDGVVATPREAFATTGGDYEIIWELAHIKFFSSKSGSVVTASYSYPTTSNFYIRPRTAGSSVIVEDAETDISVDAIMLDELVYSWWYFDGANWVTAGEYSYQRIAQILTEAKGNFPICEILGSTPEERALPIGEFRRKSRGMLVKRQALPFTYKTIRILPLGVEVRLYLRHHVPLGGEFVSMTLYCTETTASGVV